MRFEDVLGEPSPTIPRLNCPECTALREGQSCARCGAKPCPGCGIPHTSGDRRCENCNWCGCHEVEAASRLDRHCPKCGLRPCPSCHSDQNVCSYCFMVRLRDGIGTGRNWRYNAWGDAQGPPCGEWLRPRPLWEVIDGLRPW